MHRRAHRLPSSYFCERLETRLVFDSVTLLPEIQSLIDNGKLRTPGQGIAIGSPQIEGPVDAPALAGTVEAVNFDVDASTSGFYHIPPDTHGAAGLNHIVNVVNTTIQWFTKAGSLQNTQRLSSFFAAQAPLTGLFDPRVMYDQYNSRFVVVALEQTDIASGGASNTSRLMVAVSDDSDPNGTWFTTATNSSLTIGGNATWADFPQVGLDANAIYISGNMFTFGAGGTYQGSRLWIMPKAGLYAGGAASFSVYDPPTLTSTVGAFSLQPTHMFGTAPGSTGTFLVNSSFTNGSNQELLSVIRVDNPLSSPTFSNQFVNLGDIDNGASVFNVPQSGTATTVRANDRRMMDVVWRNNSLYTVNTISPGSGVDASTATVRWNRVNTTNLAALSLADGGLVSGEDIGAGTRTFFPSVSVDQNNNMAIGFSASGPNIFPGSYYTGRLSSDAAGTVQSSGVVAAGQAFYIRTFNGSGSSGNRWGDYSSIALDPSDNMTFWTYNLYAAAQGTTFSGESGRWGTRWGKFTFGAVPAAPSTPDLATASDSGSSNTDNITNDNTPTFTGTAEAGSTVTIFANGLNVGSGVATGGVYTITASPLADGAFNINATAANGSGPGPLSGTLGIQIDTLAPFAPSIPDLATASDSGGSNTDNITNLTTPTFTGTAEANSTVQLFVDAIANNSGAAVAGNWSIATTVLANGVRNLSAKATDAAGNTSPASGNLSVTIDTVAPTVGAAVFSFLNGGTTIIYPFNENVNLPALVPADFTVQDLGTLSFVSSANMAVSYNAGSNLATESFPGFSGIIPDGNYRATVVPSGVTDAAGNPVTGTLQSDFWFLQGDGNRDRLVDTQDFNLLAANFGSPAAWVQGNFNYTGTVDSSDFTIFVGKYGKRLPLPSPVLSTMGAPVPTLFATDNKIDDATSVGVLD